MGRERSRIERLERLLPDPTGQPDGLFVSTSSTVDYRGIRQYGYSLTAGGGGGSGTVTNFSAGNLSPLFTTSVATSTTTPALTFALNTQTANTVFAGPTSGGATAPTFRALVGADISALSANPTGTVGLSTVNGSASTYMRSDAAPPLSQAIAPTWSGAHTWSSTATFNGVVTSASTLNLTGVISPTLASGNNNDWAPTGIATANIIRATPNAAGSTITGITAPASAQTLWLINALGLSTITLSNADTNSSAANRFSIGFSRTLSTGQAVGLWYDVTSSRWRLLDAVNSTTGFQSAIQWQDEGSNLGSAGSGTTVNFTGAGVTASGAGAIKTITIPGGATAAGVYYYGSKRDGDLVLDGTNTYSFLSKSGSVYTATRDIYANAITYGGTGQLDMGGFRLFAYSWDPSGTSAQPALKWSANNGGNASVASGGASGAQGATNGTTSNGGAGGTGASGGTGNGNNGTVGGKGQASRNNGGQGGFHGVGSGGAGNGGATTGGASNTPTAPTPFVLDRPVPDLFFISGTGAPQIIGGGSGGSGGGSGGGGGGVGSGGGGGGGGAGGNLMFAAIQTIVVTNGLSGVISVAGGNGGNGASGSATNTGGGGGGSGGGGGVLYLVYSTLQGTSGQSMTITAAGGNGGTGGAGLGTGSNGAGGSGGNGGLIIDFNLGTGDTTITDQTGTTGSANTGTTGGTGAACTRTLTVP